VLDWLFLVHWGFGVQSFILRVVYGLGTETGF
jgi:hypothetical protein